MARIMTTKVKIALAKMTDNEKLSRAIKDLITDGGEPSMLLRAQCNRNDLLDQQNEFLEHIAISLATPETSRKVLNLGHGNCSICDSTKYPYPKRRY